MPGNICGIVCGASLFYFPLYLAHSALSSLYSDKPQWFTNIKISYNMMFLGAAEKKENVEKGLTGKKDNHFSS